jgi:hypothetical protein
LRYPGIISEHQVQRLATLITNVADASHGTRKLLDMPWYSELAEQVRAEWNLRSLLPASAQAVQCTLFVKSVEKNWRVSLHQDTSVQVAERVVSAQCSGWSQKEGNPFV